MNEIYAITDLRGYVAQMREAVAKFISEDSDENLDEFITINQMINLVHEKCLGFDDKSRPLLDEHSNEAIFESVTVWFHNVGLSKLAANGIIECAWDDESNEMIFWSPKNTEGETKNVRTKESSRKNTKTKRSDS